MRHGDLACRRFPWFPHRCIEYAQESDLLLQVALDGFLNASVEILCEVSGIPESIEVIGLIPDGDATYRVERVVDERLYGVRVAGQNLVVGAPITQHYGGVNAAALEIKNLIRHVKTYSKTLLICDPHRFRHR